MSSRKAKTQKDEKTFHISPNFNSEIYDLALNENDQTEIYPATWGK
jgi:hypothetical protein